MLLRLSEASELWAKTTVLLRFGNHVDLHRRMRSSKRRLHCSHCPIDSSTTVVLLFKNFLNAPERDAHGPLPRYLCVFSDSPEATLWKFAELLFSPLLDPTAAAHGAPFAYNCTGYHFLSAIAMLCFVRSSRPLLSIGARFTSTITESAPPLLSKIRNDLKTAMRAKDKPRLNCEPR